MLKSTPSSHTARASTPQNPTQPRNTSWSKQNSSTKPYSWCCRSSTASNAFRLEDWRICQGVWQLLWRWKMFRARIRPRSMIGWARCRRRRLTVTEDYVYCKGENIYFYYSETFNGYLSGIINDKCIAILYHWIIVNSDRANIKLCLN